MSNMTNEQTIDEIMALAGEVEDQGLIHACGEGAEPIAERDALRHAITAALAAKDAEIERLKADAERYRWLKSRPVAVPADGPDLALWADCCGDELRGNEADKAIDAAMKAGS